MKQKLLSLAVMLLTFSVSFAQEKSFDLAPGGNCDFAIPDDAVRVFEFTGQWASTAPNVKDFTADQYTQVVVKFAEPLEYNYNTPSKDKDGTQRWGTGTEMKPGDTEWTIGITPEYEVFDLSIQNIQTAEVVNGFAITSAYAEKVDGTKQALAFQAPAWNGSMSVSGVTSGVATFKGQWAGLNISKDIIGVEGKKILRIYAKEGLQDFPVQWCIKTAEGTDAWPQIGKQSDTYAECVIEETLSSIFLQYTSTEAGSIEIEKITWEVEAEPMVYATVLAGEEEIELNTKNAVSVESAEGIKVAYENVVPMATFYSISSMIEIAGEESSTWEVNEEIVAKTPIMGHGMFQADFEEPIVFEQGTKYQVAITYVTMTEGTVNPETGMATMGQPVETTVYFNIDGAYVAPAIAEVAFINGEEQIALNTHVNVSVEKAESMKVTFGKPVDVIGASYAINPMKMITDEEGTIWVADESTDIAVGELSINTYGYVEFDTPLTFEQGNKYQVSVTAYGNEGAELGVEKYVFDGAAFVPVELAAGDYFIKNVASGLYLNGSNSWGTKASATEHAQIMTLALADGKYTIDSHYSNGGNKHFLAAGDNTYLDAEPVNHTITEVEPGIYTITDPNGKLLNNEGNLANFNGTEVSAATEWVFVTKAEYIAACAEASAENPVDLTGLVPDANFSRNNTDINLWEGNSKMGKGGPNDAKDATAAGMNAEKWGGNSNSIDFHTTITDLPAGKYMVNFQGLYRYNNTADNTNDIAAAAHADGTEKIIVNFCANEDSVPFMSVADEASVELYGKMPFSQKEASEAFTMGAYQSSFETIVGEDGTLTISIVKNEADHEGCDWTVLDNIELYYLGEEPANEMEIELALINGEEENTINSHSNVSVDVANAIKVNVINAPEAIGITYLINEMNLNEDEEGTFWTVGKEIASGEANLNSIAYAELDSTLYFVQGTKYQVSVTVIGGNPAKPAEMGTFTYEINGAFAEEMEIDLALINGEEEISVNSHSNVSVEKAEALKVNVINAPEAVGITYLINEMNLVEDEEGAFWTVGAEIAAGEANLNGIAYAELDSTIYFAQGTKYQVSVSVLDQELNEIAIVKCEINGSYYEEPVDENLIEIAQNQGKDLDTFARTELVEGEDYNTYTANADLQIAMKMMNLDVEGCDYVVIKFAEPVAAGWKLAFWSNQDLCDVPEGATEFKYVFAEDSKCGVTLDESGVAVKGATLPQICMMTFFGGYQAPLVAKVIGVYKHSVGTADAINGIATTSKLNGKFIENGKIVIVKNGVKYNVAGSIIK